MPRRLGETRARALSRTPKARWRKGRKEGMNDAREIRRTSAPDAELYPIVRLRKASNPAAMLAL